LLEIIYQNYLARIIVYWRTPSRMTRIAKGRWKRDENGIDQMERRGGCKTIKGKDR